MHQRSKIETRAQGLIDTAKQSLDFPDSEQHFYGYHAPILGSYTLQLWSHSGRTQDSGSVSRNMYFRSSKEGSDCRPLLSLNIDKLVHSHEVAGLTNGVEDLEVALVELSSAEEAREVLSSWRQVLRAHHSDSTGINVDMAQELQTNFGDLLSKGSTVSFKEVGITHQDGTLLYIQSCAIEGSLQHVLQPWPRTPKVKITVRRPAENTHTVVSESEHGKLESWVEIADLIERKVQYANPEDIERDDSGKIIGGKLNENNEIVMIEAERAAGLRSLEVGRVALVEEYVHTLLRPMGGTDGV